MKFIVPLAIVFYMMFSKSCDRFFSKIVEFLMNFNGESGYNDDKRTKRKN